MVGGAVQDSGQLDEVSLPAVMHQHARERWLAAGLADQPVFARFIVGRDLNFRSLAFLADRADAEVLQQDGLAAGVNDASSGADLSVVDGVDDAHERIERKAILLKGSR